MKNRRLPFVLLALFLPCLLIFLFVFSFPANIATASTEQTTHLTEISEITGMIAAETAVSTACTYDNSYQVYLCPEPAPATPPQRNTAHAAKARELLYGTGSLLLVPDSTNDRVMAFDPATGDLVDANFIPSDSTNMATPKNAILSTSGDSIWVSDQINDVVLEYDLDGNFLGIFAPAGGPNNTILDNILGLSLRPNGNLLVTVTSGSNQDSVAEFDTAGNYLGNFVAIGAGGMDGPFDITQRPTDWVVSNINSDDLNIHDLDDGAFIAELAPINNFPQQVGVAGNGNLLIGNFSGTQEGIVELTPDGVVVDIYNPAAVGGNRGAYELPNGNILTSNASGVYEVDRLGNLVETKISGISAQYIELIQLGVPGISMSKTVGTDANSCATAEEISILPETAVTYCYTVTNTGQLSLTRHSLVDDQLGAILTDFPFTLVPGASAFITQTAVILTDTINAATWTAFNPGPIDVVTATDTVTVTILPITLTLQLTKTVGLNPSACATTDTLEVESGTAVTYCYTVHNTGNITLTRHYLADSELGTLLTDFPFTLVPGASAFLTATATITATTINTATWTAEAPWGAQTSNSDTATVTVIIPPPENYLLYLPILLKNE